MAAGFFSGVPDLNFVCDGLRCAGDQVDVAGGSSSVGNAFDALWSDVVGDVGRRKPATIKELGFPSDPLLVSRIERGHF